MYAMYEDEHREVRRARALLAGAAGAPVMIVYHADADGISAAALACAVAERLGGSALGATPSKGKSVYEPAFRDQLSSELGRSRVRAMLVLDTGSREGTRWRDVPTIVVDHHVAAVAPDVEAFVHDEGASATAMLIFELATPLVPLEDRAWLAALGVLGDRGAAARREPVVEAAAARFGRSALATVTALVNASGRAAEPEPEIALEALREVDDPRAIARGETPAARRLHVMRDEVAGAVKRARRLPPRVYGRWAVIEIEEPCRVHGVIASTWARRLAPRIVLVANKGYVPGRVHLSVRSHEDIDLRAAMRAVLPGETGDYAAGHARATGAILDASTYARLRAAIEADARPAARIG